MAENLDIYLNDHHAGSVAAIELLDRLSKAYEGQEWAIFFTTLRNEIQDDQDVLQEIIKTRGHEVGVVRQIAALAAEKLSRVKIRLSNPGEVDLGLFLALEALVLGISGKSFLWTALLALSTQERCLSKIDFSELIRRAVDQRNRSEVRRLQIVEQVYGHTREQGAGS